MMRVKGTKSIMLTSFLCLTYITYYITFNVIYYVILNNVIGNSSELKTYTIINYSGTEDSIVVRNSENQNMTMKYILQWTSPKSVPFMFMGTGRQGFIDKKCPYTNCFVTADRNYFGGDLTKFDVIAFSGPDLIRMSRRRLPRKRSPHQKYAFASIESSENYPVCSNKFNGYFNWTWTYRLDSEVRWGYMAIKDRNKKVVGPNKDMNWIKFEHMDPISDELKGQLKSKTKTAAWIVSNCDSKSKRERFVKKLKKELKTYGLKVDIYGKCGTLQCSRADEAACFKMIKDDYYFYLSFENSFSEDYVTEKLLNAVQNDAVPIVYGGANYSRFLPERSYLNARDLGAQDLAAKMNEILNNLEDYYEYFRWKKYYSYHMKWESVETNEYCLFCTTLNDERLVKENKVYQNFREWWDPPLMRC